MTEFLKMDIFFFVTTIAIIVITIVFAIALVLFGVLSKGFREKK